MTLILYNERNATLVRIENVLQIEACQARMSGRLTNVWSVLLEDGTTRSYMQKYCKIERVEMSEVFK